MKTKSTFAALVAALTLTGLAFAQAPAAPADAAKLHQQSIERLQQKNAKEAVELAEQATKADPATPAYFSQLGIALSVRMNELPFMQMAMMSGKMKKAFEKSIALDPNHVSGLIGLARFYTNAPEIAGGSLVKAAEFATRVQKIDPFLGAIEFAKIAEKDEKFDQALENYATASKLRPDNAGLQYACGAMLAKLGRKEEARARFEAALQLKPEHEPSRKALAALDEPANH